MSEHNVLMLSLYIAAGFAFILSLFATFRLRILLASRREDLMGMVIALSRMMEMKDANTEGHCSRVKQWVLEITTEMKIGGSISEDIAIAALLHDIGKIGVPDDVLLKRGRLTPEEYAIVKTHPEIGAAALASAGRFGRIAMIIENHHERFDGTGYPAGRRGRDIPLGARIVAVLDAYDAMTSDRSYRPAMPKESAVAILREGSGQQFDPEVVDLFCSILEEKREGRTDPVCGMSGTASRFIEREGIRYYFCSAACQNEFEKDPERYMNHGGRGEKSITD